MFDFYSQCTQHARLVACLHPKTLTTWPDIVRQCHDADVGVHLYRTSSENPLPFVSADSSASVRHRGLNLWRLLAERVLVHKHYLPVEHHSPVNR